MSELPNKYTVLAVAILSTLMFWLTLDTYNPAGAQPSTMFGATTLLTWIAVGLAFTHKKLWDNPEL